MLSLSPLLDRWWDGLAQRTGKVVVTAITALKRLRSLQPFPSADGLVVLAPHVDDEVLGCFGAIRHFRASGRPVMVVYLTDGAASPGPLSGPALIAARRAEAHEVCSLMGVSSVFHLDSPDGQLWRHPELASYLAEVLQTYSGAAILVPYVGDYHPDHRATGSLLLSALEGRIPVPAAVVEFQIQTPIPMVEVNCLIDITSAVAEKIDLLNRFTSQERSRSFFAALLDYHALLGRGLLAPGRWIEVYRVQSLEEFRQRVSGPCQVGPFRPFGSHRSLAYAVLRANLGLRWRASQSKS